MSIDVSEALALPRVRAIIASWDTPSDHPPLNTIPLAKSTGITKRWLLPKKNVWCFKDMRKKSRIVQRSVSELNTIATLRSELKVLILEAALQQHIDEIDVLLLTLRLGLENEKCATLTEISSILHRSPEYIRQRQYLILRRKIRNPRFFQKLEAYDLLVRLPRGIVSRNK
jgi:hypothetical protein